MQEPKAASEWTELTPVIASSCILFALGIAFLSLLFDLTYIWANSFLWWTSPHIPISHPAWAARTWSGSHPMTWMGTEEDQDVHPTALTVRGRFCPCKLGKGYGVYDWEHSDSRQILALSCRETDHKFYKCKKEISSQRFGSNPKNT